MDKEMRHREFFHIMRQSKHAGIPPAAQSLPLSPGEFQILADIMILSKESGLGYTSVSALAKQGCVSPPAVSRMLKNLDAQGYVERNADEEDRRNTRVALTDKGTRTLDVWRERVGKFMEGVLSHFTEEEFETFCELQRKWQYYFQLELEACRSKNVFDSSKNKPKGV